MINDRQRRRMWTFGAASMASVVTICGTGAADEQAPRIIEEKATVTNGTVTRSISTELPGGGRASSTATVSTSGGTASVHIRVETGEGSVRTTVVSSSSSSVGR